MGYEIGSIIVSLSLTFDLSWEDLRRARDLCVGLPIFASAHRYMRRFTNICVALEIYASVYNYLRRARDICITLPIFASRSRFMRRFADFCVITKILHHRLRISISLPNICIFSQPIPLTSTIRVLQNYFFRHLCNFSSSQTSNTCVLF